MAAPNLGAQAPGLATSELAHRDPDLPPPGAAAAHAVVTPGGDEAPQKDETPAGGPGLLGGQVEADAPDCAKGAAEGKRFATARARLALVGVGLERLGTGFVAHRWGLSRDLADLDEVEAFARRTGAPS